MDSSLRQHAVAAGIAVAARCRLPVDEAIVLQDSNRLALHLRPCDVLARVAPRAREHGAHFEVRVARLLADAGGPVAQLDPRAEPRVHEGGDFAVTLWRYHQPVPPEAIEPAEYAGALERLHRAMRQVDGTGDWIPHFSDRVIEAQGYVENPANSFAIADADRELVSTVLRTAHQRILERGAPDQLLHGEPHPGNLLRTDDGLLFVDLETCCRGPIEFDIAHAAIEASEPPTELTGLYSGADPNLVRDCWRLMLAMIVAWRFEPGDDLPNAAALTARWLRTLRSSP